MRQSEIDVRIVALLRESKGIMEINIPKFAKFIGYSYGGVFAAIKKLKDLQVVTGVDFKDNRYFLNESFIFAGDTIVDYLSKHPEGTAISAGAFSKSRNLSLELLGIVLHKFIELGVVSVNQNNSVDLPVYRLLEKDNSVWHSLFEPKIDFPKETEIEVVADEVVIESDSADHSACEIKYNKALSEAVAAQELAIRFCEAPQKIKAEFAKLEQHNKLLTVANEELRQKLLIKEQEVKFFENSNNDLSNKSRENQQRLSELQKNALV